MSRDVNDFIVEKDLDDPSFIAARTFIEQMLVQVATNPYDPQHLNILQANFNQVNCCSTGPVVLTGYVSELWRNVAYIKKEQPTWSWWRCYLEAQWDLIHFGLDILGMVPVGGEVFDVINGAIYQMQGDGVSASLSYAAALPVGGTWATFAKWAKKTVHVVDGSRATLTWFKGANGVISFGSANSKQFRRVLGLAPGNPNQAHHIIPWELAGDGTQEVIQKAAQARFPFHVQDVLNGIPLNTIQHSGKHPKYTERVRTELAKIKTKHGTNLTPEIAYHEIVDLTERIKAAILASPNTNIENILF
jgi:hypothetical protein